MKTKDIGVLIVVAIVSAVASIIISGKIFTTPEDRKEKVETVEAISTEFNRPSSVYFNSQSINPVRDFEIQFEQSNPFSGTQ